jgi:hypothetical protein
MRIVRPAVVLVIALMACSDQPSLAPSPALVNTVPPGTIQPVIQQQASASTGTLTLVVRVVGNGVTVGAYQGVVTFTPGALDLVSIETPAGTGGDFHVINATTFATGRIRFAAYAAESISGTEAFRMTVRSPGPLSEARLAAALEVVGEATGAPVAATKLHTSRGVLDAVTNQVIVP